MRRSYERLAVMRYRLRACGKLLIEEGRDGGVLNHLTKFLPVSAIELALQRLHDIDNGLIDPKNESDPSNFLYPIDLSPMKSSRSIVKREIDNFSPQRKRALRKTLFYVLAQWKRGRPGELALYFSTYLLMSKLYEISRALPESLAPCIITLEDDSIVATTAFHVRSLRSLCLESKEIDAWQLMWHRGRERAHRLLAQAHRDEYEKDGLVAYEKMETQGILVYKNYWGTEGMMWKSSRLPKQLQVIAYDDNSTRDGPWLDCIHPRCITDHIDGAYTNVVVPTTCYVNNPISERSTGLHFDRTLNHRLAIRGTSSAFYSFEYQSFGTAMALLKGWHQNDSVAFSTSDRLEALQQFHLDPNGTLPTVVYTTSIPGRWVIDLAWNLSS